MCIPVLLTSYICIYSCDYILLYQELYFQHSAIPLVRQEEEKHPKTRKKKHHYHESALRHRRRCHRRYCRRCLRHRPHLPLHAHLRLQPRPPPRLCPRPRRRHTRANGCCKFRQLTFLKTLPVSVQRLH